MIPLEDVDLAHLNAFRGALDNLLARPETELTYAQIVDGLPLLHVYQQSHRDACPPVLCDHTALCPGVLERVRVFRDEFHATHAAAPRFEPHVVQAFQSSTPGTTAFCLRLIELLAVACHQIAVFLYRLDDGIHSRSAQEDKLAADMAAEIARVPAHLYWKRWPVPPRTYFYNKRCKSWRQYPNGVADIVGYWAETRIFGGVVVFDRGISGLACDGVYLHSDRDGTGSTMYPPSEAQFRKLIAFLLTRQTVPAEPAEPAEPDPLPILGSLDNRWRWHPYYGFCDYNIYRDRYERTPQPPSRPQGHRRDTVDFPEYQDAFEIAQQSAALACNEPVNKEALNLALQNSRRITPTSPCWQGEKPLPVEGWAPWKPPYFFEDDLLQHRS